MIELACPECRVRLANAENSLRCPQCGRAFAVREGVPDLRVLDDVYVSNDRDRAMASQLRSISRDGDVRETLKVYLSLDASLSEAQRARQVEHILTANDRSAAWIEAIGSDLPAGPWLDLGCGSGSFLAVAAERGIEVIGLDVAERWLVVAAKRNIASLVCGNAERLPFLDATFAAVIAGDVIEHVSDPVVTVAEAYRVLVPGGRLFMATPNRFSLSPEPHVGVWGVGFLPRHLMAPYVWFMKRVDFRAIRTMGYRGWLQLMRESPFGDANISVPRLPKADLAVMPPLKRLLGHFYNGFVSIAPGRIFMRQFGPLFHINAQRGDTPSTTPSLHPVTNSRVEQR